MKETGRCPKCERAGRPGDQIVYLEKVSDYNAMGVQALARGGFLGSQALAYTEAYICNTCGYVEYYVKDIPLPAE